LSKQLEIIINSFLGHEREIMFYKTHLKYNKIFNQGFYEERESVWNKGIL
jgi:hypothetical protein